MTSSWETCKQVSSHVCLNSSAYIRILDQVFTCHSISLYSRKTRQDVYMDSTLTGILQNPDHHQDTRACKHTHYLGGGWRSRRALRICSSRTSVWPWFCVWRLRRVSESCCCFLTQFPCSNRLGCFQCCCGRSLHTHAHTHTYACKHTRTHANTQQRFPFHLWSSALMCSGIVTAESFIWSIWSLFRSEPQSLKGSFESCSCLKAVILFRTSVSVFPSARF